MKVFGSLLTIVGIISAIYLIATFEGPNQPSFIIGYFTIPALLLVVGLFLILKNNSLFSIKTKVQKESTIISNDMKFNTPQRIILWITAISIVVMILFPPTYYHTYEQATIFSGYQFIGTLETNLQTTQVPSILNREERAFASIYHIEPVRLSFQILGSLIVSGLFLAVFHQKSNSKSEN